jgi:hypothetical protein
VSSFGVGEGKVEEGLLSEEDEEEDDVLTGPRRSVFTSMISYDVIDEKEKLSGEDKRWWLAR